MRTLFFSAYFTGRASGQVDILLSCVIKGSPITVARFDWPQTMQRGTQVDDSLIE